MKVLFLTLKEKWYDMIEAGIKLEEYREIKPFWIKRLSEDYVIDDDGLEFTAKDFTHVHFARGGHFHPTLPQMRWELKEIIISTGNPEWGAEAGKEYFVIKLGEIIKP